MISHVRAATDAWTPGVARETYEDMNDLTLSTFLVALFGSGLPRMSRRSSRASCRRSCAARSGRPSCRLGDETAAAGEPRARAAGGPAAGPHRPGHRPPPGPAGVSGAAAPPPGCPAHQERRAARGHRVAAGLFSTLLTADDPETGPLSRQQLQDEAITLLTGAIETTGRPSRGPCTRSAGTRGSSGSLHAELDAACGERPLRQEDLGSLPYMRSVLKEAMRMYGPAWLVTRTTTRPVVLDGVPIPEGRGRRIQPVRPPARPRGLCGPRRLRPGPLGARARQEHQPLLVPRLRGRPAQVHRRGVRLDRTPHRPGHRRPTLAADPHLRSPAPPGHRHGQARQALDDTAPAYDIAASPALGDRDAEPRDGLPGPTP